MNVERGTWVAAIGALALVHAPVLVLVLFSFNDSRYSAQWQGFTLRWYARLWERPEFAEGLATSLLVGGTSSVIAVAAAVPLALAAADRWAFGGAVRGPRSAPIPEWMLYLPLGTPEIVSGIAFLGAFVALGVPLGLGTVIAAHVAFQLPVCVLLLVGRLRGMDPVLEEAARVLGADPRATFLRVMLPQLAPAIGGALLLSFVLSFDDFVITTFVAGQTVQTLPIVIYNLARRNIEPSIHAMSALVVLATTLAAAAAARVSSRSGGEP